MNGPANPKNALFSDASIRPKVEPQIHYHKEGNQVNDFTTMEHIEDEVINDAHNNTCKSKKTEIHIREQ